eukprot:991896-Amphidinium_carterae.1
MLIDKSTLTFAKASTILEEWIQKYEVARKLRNREAALSGIPEEEEEKSEDSDEQEDEASEDETQSEAVLEEESSSDSEESSSEESSVEGAMAFVTEVTSEEETQPQAHATTTKTPMFLDPAGKAYALADSGATNVTLNLKHLRKHKADATPVEMTLASGKVATYLYRDEVFAEDVKTPLCPLRRIARNLEITIEWTKDHCLLVLQGKPLMRLLLKKGLHYLTETQFALIRQALPDYAEGMADVNQLSYWTRFKGKTAKQILASDPELIAASMK